MLTLVLSSRLLCAWETSRRTSWEGYAIEEAIDVSQPDEVYFWATHQGAELDLLLLKDGRRLGVEARHADAPVLTRSMRIALEDLKLEHLAVLYPGTQRYSLSDQVTVVPLAVLASGGMDSLFPRRRTRSAREFTAGGGGV